MHKITVIGKFIGTATAADGQSIKTRIITRELEKALDPNNVHRIDTFGWKKNPLKLFLNTFSAVQKSANVVFMTDAGGIKVFPWLLLASNVFSRAALHYVVVGGWLVGYLKSHRLIAGCLKRFRGIYVETQVMKTGLESLGFQNVVLMPNFKDLTVLPEEDMVFCGEPYKLCTFSRVMEEKGIADAARAVIDVNRHYNRTVCTLDIYGQVDPRQTDWFECLCSSFSAEVRYCGIIPYDQSVDVIRQYHMLLFPTKFYTEGIPGTIIDAYAAGVPVLASRWESFVNVIDDGKTGFGYPWAETDALRSHLIALMADPAQVYHMKKHCLQKATEYLPGSVMNVLLTRLS